MSFNFGGEYVKSKRIREYYNKDNMIFEKEFLIGHKTGENDAVR